MKKHIKLLKLKVKFNPFVVLFILFILFIVVLATVIELATSIFQANVFHEISSKASFNVVEGKSSLIRFPTEGPYDIRLGYTILPDAIEKLSLYDFKVEQQARISEYHAKLIDKGIFPIYREKFQAGLTLVDRDGNEIFKARYPERVYRKFEDIPPLVLNSLLFIEDRHLLNGNKSWKNPAIELDRFIAAIFDVFINIFLPNVDVQGGSTLATQTEKFRHSHEGRTNGIFDKLRQMISASLRAYHQSPKSLIARRQIALQYINSVPLSAVPGFGEVNGLGDGLWAYFGQDFDQINRLLHSDYETLSEQEQRDYNVAFRQVLSLFLAHRRPSFYLLRKKGRENLEQQVLTYLKLLTNSGYISSKVSEATIKTVTAPSFFAFSHPEKNTFSERKIAYSLRASLLNMLGATKLYELDRFDLNIHSTIDLTAQSLVRAELKKLADKEYSRKIGLIGGYLLSESNDLSKVIYSFTLYEKEAGRNVLRVQADNYNGPLNINEGVKLDLGSTAKLRTLITYLQVINECWENYYYKTREELLLLLKQPQLDPLTFWSIEYLAKGKDVSLDIMLRAAMNRQYSGSPGESFFTAGGLHTFHNFNNNFNGSRLTIWQALQHSVNLPFIRIMRDIVRYYTQKGVSTNATTYVSGLDDKTRAEYLRRFADKEGKVFMRGYYKKYGILKTDKEILNKFLEGTKKPKSRLATLMWQINPTESADEFGKFIINKYPDSVLTYDDAKDLHATLLRYKDSLSDQAYIASVHPLELWTAGFLFNKPLSDIDSLYKASVNQRQESYKWLFRKSLRRAQDQRIKIMLESEAFQEIHRSWEKLGYDQGSLIPSYATSLGVSADTPGSLAKLMGIIANEGQLAPSTKFYGLLFGSKTPFETRIKVAEINDRRVLSKEVVAIAKEALTKVVQGGTAVRIKDGISDGKFSYQVIGKTGTGDHRHKVFRGGRNVATEVRNRTATIVFILGDKFFGTLTVFVPGKDAEKFKFTSSLTVQLLKHLGSSLASVLRR
jgi:membrane peptidoglycan carboxypeptidase